MGKNGVKTVLSIGAFFLGAGGWNPFGLGAIGASGGLMGGMMGMSLINTIWAATHKPEQPSYDNASRFDQMMNTVSSESMVTVIYGRRKWAGNQLWHSASSDGRSLTKDVLVGEGECHGITEVKFNDTFVGIGNLFTVSYTGTFNDKPTFSKNTTKITLSTTTTTLTYAHSGKTLNDIVTWINAQASWSAKLILPNAKVTDIDNAKVPLGYSEYSSLKASATITAARQGLFSVKYIGSATTATFSKNATKVILMSSTGTYEYEHTNHKFPELIAWINAQESWSSTVISTTSTIEDIPVATSTNCKNTDVVIIGKPYPPGCSFEFHNGSLTQEPPDNFDIVGGYRRMAWIRANMKVSEQLQGNNPTVTYVAKGLKVLDTRTGAVAWSDNNAMCLRDFLLSKRYGISKFVHGMTLDEQSFKEAADYCDELVNYYDANGILKQEKRYTLNIILDQKRKANEHLDAIMATFGGFLVNSNGVISLRIEKPETSAYHFTNDTIIENSVNVEQLSLDESPNQYKIGYFDETQNWTQVKALVNDIIGQQLPPAGKGKVVTKELTLDGCISQSQALRLGRLYKLKNKLCSLTMTFKTSTFAMHLQCGDVVTMTYDKVDDDGAVFSVFVDKPWRIIEISEQDGVYTVKAREYNESIYGDVTEAIVIKEYCPIDNPLGETMNPPTGFVVSEYGLMGKDGSHVSNIDIAWDAVNSPFFRQYIVSYSTDGETCTSLPILSTTYRIPNVKQGDKYSIAVQWQNSVGRISDKVTSEITVVGKDNPPKDVMGFKVIQQGNSLFATLTPNDEPDFSVYEIRRGMLWESSEFVGQFIESQYTFPAVSNGTSAFLVKTKDRYGNYSAHAMKSVCDIYGIAEKNVIYSGDVALDSLKTTDMSVSNNALSIKLKETLNNYNLFFDMFSNNYHLLPSPSIVFPVIDLGANIIDDKWYYTDSEGNQRIKAVEKLSDYHGFFDMFNSNYHIGNPTYKTETFLGITFDYNASPKNGIDVTYSTSLDGLQWSPQIPLSTTSFFGRYVVITAIPRSYDGITNVNIKSIKVSIDVPDIQDTVSNIAIPAALTTIAFHRKFYAVPTDYYAFTTDINGKSVTCSITNVTMTSFDIQLFDDGNNAIPGILTNATIRGY